MKVWGIFHGPDPIACKGCGKNDAFESNGRSLDHLYYRCACGRDLTTLSETGASA